MEKVYKYNGITASEASYRVHIDTVSKHLLLNYGLGVN